MEITLYTTNCPKCVVLEKKLDNAKLSYNLVDDVEVMEAKGFMAAPMLEVDGKIMDFKQAVDWINEMEDAE